MKINLRFVSSNPDHTHMTLFVNGKNSGNLCMSPAEATKFSHVLDKGAKHLNSENGTARYEFSGKFADLPNVTDSQVHDA